MINLFFNGAHDFISDGRCLLKNFCYTVSLVQIHDLKLGEYLLFSHSTVSDSFRLHGLQHSRLPCPSLSPRACSNSCPLSQSCYPTISCHPLLPSIFPDIRAFSSESVLHHQRAKVLEFQLQHQPFIEYSLEYS